MVLSSPVHFQLVLAELQLTVVAFVDSCPLCYLICFESGARAGRIANAAGFGLRCSQMLPGNHLVRVEPMSATDYKPLTATLDPFS